jgi:hypothetical protein
VNVASGGGWISPPGQVNAPQAFVHNGQYYFHVAQANDQNLNLIPWYIGLADNTGNISTIATIDWTSKISGVTVCYSGEWFQESNGTVHLFVPCNFAIYETHATNDALTTWSDPQAITVNESDIYDSKVWLIGSTYYMWLSNQDSHYVELASGSNLLGPYTMQKTGDWAGWGTPKEGPTMYSTGPASWRLAIEDISGDGDTHQMYYSDCNTLDLLACTWTGLQPWTEDHLYRHGSVIKNH